MGKLIRAAKAGERTKPLGHRLYRASHHDDPGLIYLREARNVAEHGLTPRGRYTPSSVDLGNGLIRVGENSHLTIGELRIGGKSYGRVEVHPDEKGAPKVDASTHLHMKHNQSKLLLEAVTNEENGKTAVVPNRIGGVPLDAGNPLDLAANGLEYLKGKGLDFVKLTKGNSRK